MNSNFKIEDLFPDFIDSGALILPPTKIYRTDVRGLRYYFTFDEETLDIVMYPSITTALGVSVAKDKHLNKWMAEMGWSEAWDYISERSDYGTFFHIQCAKFLRGMSIYPHELRSEFERYALIECSRPDFKKFVDKHMAELEFDIESFSKWCTDYNVKPLFIEGQLKSEELGVALTLDLLCERDHVVKEKRLVQDGVYKRAGTKGGEAFEKGDPKMVEKVFEERTRVKSIVDFKSGQYTGKQYDLQLEAARIAVKENFGIDVHSVLNFAPKDHKLSKSAGYYFPDKTNSIHMPNLEAYLQIARTELSPESILDRPFVQPLVGHFNIGGEMPHREVMTLREAIVKRMTGEFEADSDIDEDELVQSVPGLLTFENH